MTDLNFGEKVVILILFIISSAAILLALGYWICWKYFGLDKK